MLSPQWLSIAINLVECREAGLGDVTLTDEGRGSVAAPGSVRLRPVSTDPVLDIDDARGFRARSKESSAAPASGSVMSARQPNT